MNSSSLFSRLNLESIKDVIACIQGVAIVASIIGGGYWAYTRFGATLEAERAKVEYEKATKELRERQAINLKINAKQLLVPNATRRQLTASIEMTNIGNKAEFFYWKDAEFSIARVVMTEEGEILMEESSARQVYPATSKSFVIRILPGETESVHYLATVKTPGLYFLTIKVVPMQEGGYQLSHIQGEPEYWGATSHLIVE
jgi:hypothetical protein